MNDTSTRQRSNARLIRWRIAGMLVLVWLYLFVGVFDHELWPPTEQAFAGVTWEMFRSGDLLVPRINGLPYLEKPPLAYALSWVGFELAGRPGSGLLRLPEALLGLAGLGLLFWIARYHFGERAAWGVTLLCATTANYFGIMHRASTDAVAVAFCFACFALFMRTMAPAAGTPAGWSSRGLTPPPGSARYDLWFCLLLALSFFVKNFYTFLVIVPPVTIYLAGTRQFARLVRIGAVSTVILIAMLAPWAWLLHAQGGNELLRVVFIDNTFGRFLNLQDAAALMQNPLNDASVVHKRPFWFGPQALISHSLPWILVDGAALYALYSQRARNEASLFLKIAFAALMIFVTLSSSKVSAYYLPVIFLLSMITGNFLRGLDVGLLTSASYRRLVAANIGLVLAVLLAAPVVGAILLDFPALYALLPLNIAGAGAVLYWLRRRGPNTRDPRAWGGFAAASIALSLGIAIPHIDQERSWQPFYDLIRDESAPRELWTTVDDRKLPATNFYLDRRVELARNSEQLLTLLRGSKPVSAIVWTWEYDQIRDQLKGVPHSVVRAPSGHDRLIYLDNTPK